MLNEDEVLHLAAEFLRGIGFRILALGANQATRFRFSTELARRKAPDLAAFRHPILLVCEAKVRAAALLTGSHIVESDYQCMLHLSRSREAQEKVKTVAERFLKISGSTHLDEVKVCAGLITATPYPASGELVNNTEILLLEVDQKTSTVNIIRDPKSCLTSKVATTSIDTTDDLPTCS